MKFHDDRPANVFKITKYTYTDDSVRVSWLNGADELVMAFAEFNGSHTAMAQQENDDKPRRASIAAETSSYLGKVGANLRGFKLERRKICPPKTAFYYGQR